MVRMSPKTLATYFLILFVAGVLGRIFISPLLWAGIPEIVNPFRMLLSFALLGLGLVVIYYLIVQGSPKTKRLFFAVCFGLGAGFAIFAVVITVLTALYGPVPSLYFFSSYLAMVIVGVYIGDKVGRKLKIY